MESRTHQVLFGKLEINVFDACVQIKNRSGIFREEIVIPFPHIKQVFMDERKKQISIETRSQQYTYYLGGLMTTQSLFRAISSAIRQ